jgi:hypothetical protein
MLLSSVSCDPALTDRKKDLLQQIQEEGRLIRIHEAELRLLGRSNTRKRCDNDNDCDWLDTLDQLQCKQNDDEPTLDTRWHDDPIHRVLPRIAGVFFTDVFASSERCFEFHAVVSAARATQLQFILVLEVEDSRIVHLAVRYPSMHETSELNDATQPALKGHNFPWVIRLLLRWAKLDAKRREIFQQLVEEYACVILTSSTVSIRGVVVSWTMNGLSIVSGAPMTCWDAYLTCCRSIEEALKTLCRAITVDLVYQDNEVVSTT